MLFMIFYLFSTPQILRTVQGSLLVLFMEYMRAPCEQPDC